MKNPPQGCVTSFGLLAALLTGVIVTGLAIAKGGILFSPGALNAQSGTPIGNVRSHAEISGQCSLCHAPFWNTSTMADRCVVCHADVSIQFSTSSPLHGQLQQSDPNLTCRDCHPDHRGPNSPLTDLVNIDFQHNSFGYSLSAHQHKTDGSSFTCKDCHANDYSRYDQGICTRCHSQISGNKIKKHVLDFGNDCLACHDGVETYGHLFNHDNVNFKLSGKHFQVACAQCHPTARDLSDLQSTSTGCVSCHLENDVHLNRLGSNCESCHTTGGWIPASFDHNLAAFKLVGQHIRTPCADCHVNHVLQGTSTDCISCHAQKDVHEGRLGTKCDSCHTADSWTTATFDHNLSTFKLTGKHIAVPCLSCHVNHVLQDTPTDCFSCHASKDAHSGLYGTDCGACHSTIAWKPATFNHSRVGFSLTGAHTSLSCFQCHSRGAFGGLSPACVSCHSTPATHAGISTNCSQCHGTSNWSSNFIHSSGCEGNCADHQQATCADCHPNNYSTYTCLKCHGSNNPGD